MNYILLILAMALPLVSCTKLRKGPDSSRVIAKVAGDSIPVQEFEENYQFLKQSMEHNDPDMLQSLKGRALNELIISRILRQEAEKQGVTVAKEEIDERFANWKDTLSQEKLSRLFNRFGKSETLIKKRIEYLLLINRLMASESREEVRVSDDEVTDYLKQLGKPSKNTGALPRERSKVIAYLKHIKEMRFYKEWVTKLLKEREVLRNDDLYAKTI